MENILEKVEAIKSSVAEVSQELKQLYFLNLDDEEKLSEEGYNIVYQTASLANILAILEETFDE